VSAEGNCGSRETTHHPSPPSPELGRAQKLPIPILCTNLHFQLNDLHVNTEGMGNRIDIVSLISGLEKISLSARLDLPYT